jgi:hypothetical protein
MQVSMFQSYEYVNIFIIMSMYILFHNEYKEAIENFKYCQPKMLPDVD